MPGQDREAPCLALQESWPASTEPAHQHGATMRSRGEPGGVGGARPLMCRQTMWPWRVGARGLKVTSAGARARATPACGSCGTVRRGWGCGMRLGAMLTHGRSMPLRLLGMPACRRARSRPSNAARSGARRDPERHALRCLQTLKNGPLTHPSLEADHSSQKRQARAVWSSVSRRCLSMHGA